MQRLALALALFVLGLGGPGANALAPAPPRLEMEASERPPLQKWVLTALPPIFAGGEVGEHLKTGLTTSIVFRLALRGRAGDKITGGARVQVRYELWDEVYHAAALSIDGGVDRRTLASLDELDDWWRGLRLVLLERRAEELAPAAAVRLDADVVPFSHTEHEDAQRWFSESLDRSESSSAEEVGQSAGEQPETLSRMLNLLMSASIKRRPLLSYRWDLSVPPAEVPEGL